MKPITGILITTAFLLALVFLPAEGALAGEGDNVSGWAWSENIGWISFNNISGGGDIVYGVSINADTGQFSGYAWSENIGWISFNPSDLAGCPSEPCQAQLDLQEPLQGVREVSGWARALAYDGDWQGWIRLRDTDYGVSVDMNTGEFSGWAWSDMVVGWIHFKGTDYEVVVDLSFFNQPPDKPSGLNDYWDNCWYEGKSLPMLSWSEFYDDDGDTQAGYEIQIGNNASLPNDPPGQGEFREVSTFAANSYNPGYRAEEWANWMVWDKYYHWVVRVKDSHDNWSEWSDPKKFDAKSPKHPYPWPDFSWLPEDPNQGEVVVFTPEQTGLYYLWTITEGEGIFADETAPTSEEPHIKFSTPTNKIKLKVTDSVPYSCESRPVEGTLLEAQMPLPEYKEVPPITWLKKVLSGLVAFFNGF